MFFSEPQSTIFKRYQIGIIVSRTQDFPIFTLNQFPLLLSGKSLWQIEIDFIYFSQKMFPVWKSCEQ